MKHVFAILTIPLEQLACQWPRLRPHGRPTQFIATLGLSLATITCLFNIAQLPVKLVIVVNSLDRDRTVKRTDSIANLDVQLFAVGTHIFLHLHALAAPVKLNSELDLTYNERFLPVLRPFGIDVYKVSRRLSSRT